MDVGRVGEQREQRRSPSPPSNKPLPEFVPRAGRRGPHAESARASPPPSAISRPSPPTSSPRSNLSELSSTLSCRWIGGRGGRDATTGGLPHSHPCSQIFLPLSPPPHKSQKLPLTPFIRHQHTQNHSPNTHTTPRKHAQPHRTHKIPPTVRHRRSDTRNKGSVLPLLRPFLLRRLWR